MIKYSPDTCDCVVEFDPNGSTFSRWHQRCFLHKDLDGQALLDAVLAHNRTFKIVNNATAKQVSKNVTDKRTEKTRIQSLGQVEKISVGGIR